VSKRKLPNYRSKQKILYIDNTPAATLIDYGDQYWDEQAFDDALDFYAKAGHTSGIEKLSAAAMEKGDVFLYQRASRALHREITPADWRKIAGRAVELEKITFAKRALEKIDDPAVKNDVEAMIKTKEAEKRT